MWVSRWGVGAGSDEMLNLGGMITGGECCGWGTGFGDWEGAVQVQFSTPNTEFREHVQWPLAHISFRLIIGSIGKRQDLPFSTLGLMPGSDEMLNLGGMMTGGECCGWGTGFGDWGGAVQAQFSTPNPEFREHVPWPLAHISFLLIICSVGQVQDPPMSLSHLFPLPQPNTITQAQVPCE